MLVWRTAGFYRWLCVWRRRNYSSSCPSLEGCHSGSHFGLLSIAMLFGLQRVRFINARIRLTGFLTSTTRGVLAVASQLTASAVIARERLPPPFPFTRVKVVGRARFPKRWSVG